MSLTKEKRLFLALMISLFILFIEVIGGLLSNSLALLSDAGHVLTDAFAIALSLMAAMISKKPSDFRATYGYQRIGLLAAIINGISLFAVAGYIFYEGYRRFVSPPHIEATLMLTVAVAGLIGNGIMAMILSKGHHDLNIKSAWLHIIGDLLASVGVVIAGIILYFTNFKYADPIASTIVGLLVLIGGIRVVRDALWVFLELAPAGYNLQEITKAILSVPEVQGLHDVHLWSISHGRPAFSAHVWINDVPLSKADEIRKRIEQKLSQIGINHTVIQLECTECEKNGLYCQLRTEEFHYHH
jgi:cobalt-zinc-cadmium efflux system protein